MCIILFTFPNIIQSYKKTYYKLIQSRITTKECICQNSSWPTKPPGLTGLKIETFHRKIVVHSWHELLIDKGWFFFLNKRIYNFSFQIKMRFFPFLFAKEFDTNTFLCFTWISSCFLSKFETPVGSEIKLVWSMVLDLTISNLNIIIPIISAAFVLYCTNIKIYTL